MMSTTTDFYKELLTTEPSSMEMVHRKQEVWATISPRVRDEMKRVLRQPFSLEEVDGAITALPKLSCPGEDGLPPLFFKKYWDVIKQLVCEAFQEIVDNGALPQRFRESQAVEIQKWRPITILTTIYKILAKAITVLYTNVCKLVLCISL